MKIVKPSVELLWITPNPELEIEKAGRTCYKSEGRMTPESSGEFCKMMKDRGHHAMVEHAVASFKIITDRGITHEIVRHRIASFAQESTRYCNYFSDKFEYECSFIRPPGMNIEQEHLWLSSCEYAEDKYFEMINAGCSPQIARSVLPTCLKTEIVMTTNFRSWLNFIYLRSSMSAHPQIRPIAIEINNILADHAPSIFEKM